MTIAACLIVGWLVGAVCGAAVVFLMFWSDVLRQRENMTKFEEMVDNFVKQREEWERVLSKDDYCAWVKSPDGKAWKTTCPVIKDPAIIDGIAMRFCPFCGRKLVGDRLHEIPCKEKMSV